MPRTPVFIGLDCEDAFNPEADDALLRLCRLHSDVGIPLNLFIAGQKARVLRRNGRRDVIEAMRDHDICYHGNYWFDYPEPAMVYGARDDWDTALSKALAVEVPGLNDVAEITGRPPAAYVQHQGNHSPATNHALRLGGVRVNNGGFGDDMPHNAWVMDMLFVGRAKRTVGYQGAWSALADPLEPEREKPASDPDKQFRAFQESFDRQLGKGCDHVNVVGHPTCWHFAEWWGWHDFSLPFRLREEAGAVGPFSHDRQWRKPMARSAADIEAHFEWTRQAAEWLASRDDIEVLKLSDYHTRHAEPAGPWLTLPEVRGVARALGKTIDAVPAGPTTLSAADALVLLATLGEHVVLFGKFPEALQVKRALAPVEAVPELTEPLTFRRDNYLLAARVVYNYVMTHGRIPHAIRSHRVDAGPAQVLCALAQAFAAETLPESVCVEPMDGLPACAQLPIFQNARAGSTNAPPFWDNARMNLLCKLQSWSYRPLTPRP